MSASLRVLGAETGYNPLSAQRSSGECQGGESIRRKDLRWQKGKMRVGEGHEDQGEVVGKGRKRPSQGASLKPQ